MKDIQATDCLKDKIILVTGASSGIGRTAALTYAKHGATVILLARNTKNLEQVFDEIEALKYPTPAIYPFNLTNANPDDYVELFKVIKEKYHKLDGMLHNAAMLGACIPIEHYPIDKWYQVMQTNLHSAFLLAKTGLDVFKLAPNASILFTTDSVGAKPKAYWGAYGIAKSGINNLTVMLAEELAHLKIRVNCIDPGPTNTKLRALAFPGIDKSNLANPVDLISEYLYFMADNSLEVSGKIIKAQESSLAIA